MKWRESDAHTLQHEGSARLSVVERADVARLKDKRMPSFVNQTLRSVAEGGEVEVRCETRASFPREQHFISLAFIFRFRCSI